MGPLLPFIDLGNLGMQKVQLWSPGDKNLGKQALSGGIFAHFATF